jgi:hypothetical protein
MAIRYGYWPFTEGSGASVADRDPNPVNLTIATSGASAWSSSQGSGWHNAGNPLSTIKSASLSGSKIASGLAASKTGAWSFCYATSSTGGVELVGLATTGDASQFELYCSSAWWGNQQLFSSITFTRDGTYHHLALVVDSAASPIGRIYQDGFSQATSSGSVSANRLIDSANALSTGIVCITCGGDGGSRLTGDIYWAALYNTLAASQVLDHAVKLRSNNDFDPDAGPSHIYGASSNSGTNDASTSSSDTAFTATMTIGAAGLNRIAIVHVSYEGNTPSTVAFDPAGTNVAMHLVTSSVVGSQGVAEYYLLDSELPGAGTYNITVTLGSGGTGCAMPIYLEGMAQAAPTNTITANGTSTSQAGTLPSNPAVGSFVLAALFDDTTGDTPTVAVPQTVLPKVNGTSTGNTHTLGGSASYVSASASTTVTFSGLTNTSQKLLLAVEWPAIRDSLPLVWEPSGSRHMRQNPAFYNMKRRDSGLYMPAHAA